MIYVYIATIKISAKRANTYKFMQMKMRTSLYLLKSDNKGLNLNPRQSMPYSYRRSLQAYTNRHADPRNITPNANAGDKN